ncbi:hypothetical protein GQ231_001110 [Salmonella enterica]|nr:hypothetical protein [Salmonella enterica]
MNKLNSGLNASGSAHPEISMAVATPESIRIIYNAGAVKLVAYKKVVTWLGKGRYDYDSLSGYRITEAFLAGVEMGYIPFYDDGVMSVYRWIASIVYFDEQAHKNGVIDVPDPTRKIFTAAIYKGKSTSITIYPLMLRKLITDTLEATAFKEYGRKAGLKVAIMSFTGMVEPAGEVLAVSPFGNEFFSRSLEGLILHIQKITSGSGGSNPAKSVIH